MERASDSSLYLSLWDEFLTNTLLPELDRRYLSPHSESKIRPPPELCQRRLNPTLYRFTCDRVKVFLESRCRKYLLRIECDMSKYGSIEQVKALFDRLTTLDAEVISQALAPFADAFLEADAFPPPHSKTIVADIFRRCIYYKFAHCLREEAFRAISDELKVQDPLTLTSYFCVMKRIGGEEKVAFCREEWDKPLYERISKKLLEPISKWESKTLPELLENIETFIEDCSKIFMFFGGDTGNAIMKEIGKARNLLLFKNEGEEIKKIFVDARNSETLKHLFDLFHDDNDFLKTIAYHASQFYSDMVYGRSKESKNDLYKDERTVEKLLSVWFRIHNILVEQNVKRKAVQVALVDPFMALTELTAKYPEIVTKVLTRVFCGLLSKSTNGHHKLNQSSLEKLLAVSSLSNFLSAAEPFPEALRVFLSKYLLQWSSSSIDISILSEQNSATDQNVATNGLSMLLEDACDWDFYRSEMAPIIRKLQEIYGKTQIDLDLRFVHRPLWDLGPDVGFIFPTNLQAVSDNIIQNFQSLHPARSASIHSLAGHMIISSNVWSYNGNRIRICLSTGQGCVLAAFGDKDISLEELSKKVLVNRKEGLGLPVLVAILKSLMNEHPILRKKPENTDFRETDTFSLNLQFQPKSDIIELPVPECIGRSEGSRAKAALNHISGIDLEQVIRAAVMKLLKHEREVEMSRVKDMVVERLSALYDLTQVNFGEVVRKLEVDEYVTVEGSIVQYIL